MDFQDLDLGGKWERDVEQKEQGGERNETGGNERIK